MVSLVAESLVAGELPGQKECESGVAKSCIGYSIELLKAGRAPESEKLLRKMCDKNDADGCLALAAFHKPADAEAYFGKSCVKSPKNCNDMFLFLGYRGDQKYTAKLASTACTAGHKVACDIAKNADKNAVDAAIQGPEMIKEIEPKITATRNQNRKKKIDYDLEKFSLQKMEQEIMLKSH
jgi:hypothetical protein